MAFPVAFPAAVLSVMTLSGKHERRTLLLFLLILTTFIALGSSVIYRYEREEHLQVFTQYAEREMVLLSGLLEASFSGSNAAADAAVEHWLQGAAELTAMTVTAADGALLKTYVRSAGAQYPLTLQQKFTLKGRGEVTIRMTWDVAVIYQRLQHLVILLIAAPVILILLLLALLWWVLRHTLLKPLHGELEKNERYNRLLFEQSPVGSFLCRMDGELLDVNPAFAGLLGYNCDELLLLNNRDITPQSYAEDDQRQLQSLKVSGRYGPYEKELIHKDGHRVAVQLQGLLLEKYGEQLIWSSVDDLSQRRQTEETVRHIAAGVSAQTGEAFFQSLVLHLAKIFNAKYTFIGLLNEQDQSQIDTLVLCVHGRIIDNLSYSLSDSPCEHVLQGDCESIQTFPHDVQRLFPKDKLLAEMGAESYVGFPLVDSNCRPIGLIVIMDTRPMFNTEQVGTVLRIFAARAAWEMERLKTEQALSKSVQEWAYAMDAFEDAIYLIDLDDKVVRANQAFYQLSGLSAEQVIGQDISHIIHPRGEQIPCPVCSARMARRDEYITMEANHPDNPTSNPIEVMVRIIRDDQGEPMAILMSIHDLSRSRKAEAEILEREQQIRDLLESTAEAIYGLDLHGRCTFANPACVRMLGYDNEQQLLDKNMHQLIHHSHVDGSAYDIKDSPIEQVFHTGAGTHIDNEVLWRADGSSFHAEYWSYPIRRDIEVTGAVVTFLDISARRQTEEALRRSQKMEAIGQLSGGIAHDFNNQLGVIIGYLDFLQDYTADNDRAGKWVETATRATLRCMDLTRQLLAFSRKQSKEKNVLQLNTVIRELETMISRSVTPAVSVQYALDSDAWPAEINAGEFQDAMLNLVINARDAMPGGGVLRISSRNQSLDTDYVAQHPDTLAGDFIELSISDTGTGMDQETQSRMFEPFYTTKSKDKGTGLGMAMVYGFVQRFNGFIRVSSELNTGTVIQIYLPRSIAAVEDLLPGSDNIPHLPEGNETILVVDDEIELLQLAENYLTALGYQVYSAENATQALALLHSGQVVDLLFSDVVMPGGINGYELAQQALQLQPRLKILLTSGFTSRAIAANENKDIVLQVLNKPYRKDDLAQRIRLVLDEK